MNLYVYFKFVPKDPESVITGIKKMQEELTTRFFKLNCQLLKRPEKDSEGRETWMEVYSSDSADMKDFKEELSALAGKYQLPEPRFYESFIPLE